MSDEPVDWTKDKFGQGIPSGIRYDKMRDNNNFDPIQQETLYNYTERLYKWIKNIEEINLNAHIFGRKTWYTHRDPTACWLCDTITIHWKLHETLRNIQSTLPNDGKDHIFTSSSTTGTLTLTHDVNRV